MEWLDIIKKRKTTYRWTSAVPDSTEIEKIINQIHEYCPSKQKKVPFFIDVIDNTDPNAAPKAVELLIQNKSYIEFQLLSENSLYNKRDIGVIIASIINDIRYSTNQYTRDYVSSYWMNKNLEIKKNLTISICESLENIIINDIFLKLLDIEVGTPAHVSNLIKDLKLGIENGVSSLPELVPGLPRLRMKLWESADRKGLGNIYDIRNPQILAPWLLVFSQRKLTDEEIGLNSEMKDDGSHEKISNQEIGMASMFACLSAENLGFDTAFCACMHNKEEIASLLGHTSSDLHVVILGIGYRESSPGNTYFNKLVYDNLNIPDSDYDTRPSKMKYVKYHTNS